jgi:cytochrome o ubiquinol oxidase operon protein cyoD
MSTNRYFEEIGAWPHGSPAMIRSYMTGFVLSLLLTFAAFALVVDHRLPAGSAVLVLLVLACVQFALQAFYFLHLDRKTSSRERIIVLVAILVIMVIVVAGSLWIMAHLNERMMMTPHDMQTYMNEQPGI